MSAATPNHYDTLGVTSTATPDEIKRRYRELARRYHPDVSKTPDSASKFKEINEANSVLSDPEKRANYDARLKLDEMRRNQQTPPPTSSASSTRPATNAGTSNGANADRSGFSSASGSRASGPSSASSKPSAPAGSARPAGPSPVEKMIEDARKALTRLKYRDAEALCRQANRIKRTAPAYELLGDIYRSRGREDDAIAMYSYALQLDKNNRSLQMKFDRLVGQSSGATFSGNAARSAGAGINRGGGRRARGGDSVGSGLEKAPVKALMTLLGIAPIAALLYGVSRIANPPATTLLFLEWDPLLLAGLAASGIFAGLLASVNGIVGRAGSELASQSGSTSARAKVPLGAILLGFSLLFFYASFALYLALGLLQNTFSKSWMWAFGAAFLLCVAFAIASPVSAVYILLCGGNIAFLSFIAGWGLGDLFRQPR